MIVRITAVEFAAARAVDDNPENVVLAQRLHRASHRIDGSGSDANHQNGSVTERG